jgi:hypothetical protein
MSIKNSLGLSLIGAGLLCVSSIAWAEEAKPAAPAAAPATTAAPAAENKDVPKDPADFEAYFKKSCLDGFNQGVKGEKGGDDKSLSAIGEKVCGCAAGKMAANFKDALAKPAAERDKFLEDLAQKSMMECM